MPVLPEVGSTMTERSGEILPSASASRDHGDANPVLDAADRVEEFELCQKVGLDALLLGDLVETHERRIADSLDDRIINAPAPRRLSRAWVAGGLPSLRLAPSCFSCLPTGPQGQANPRCAEPYHYSRSLGSI